MFIELTKIDYTLVFKVGYIMQCRAAVNQERSWDIPPIAGDHNLWLVSLFEFLFYYFPYIIITKSALQKTAVFVRWQDTLLQDCKQIGMHNNFICSILRSVVANPFYYNYTQS